MMSGKLVVLTGPSGVGKGTIVHSLLNRYPDLYLSISATTRSPRAGEIHGKDYYFVNNEKFEEMIRQNQLLEWAQYAGNYYGTPRLNIEDKISKGFIVLLEIEVAGAKTIKKTFSNVLRIFILPPSFTELENRLRGRATDSEQAIKKRLKLSKEELAVSQELDKVIINSNLEKTLEQLELIIFSA